MEVKKTIIKKRNRRNEIKKQRNKEKIGTEEKRIKRVRQRGRERR